MDMRGGSVMVRWYGVIRGMWGIGRLARGSGEVGVFVEGVSGVD
jgi:hypothetical protein